MRRYEKDWDQTEEIPMVVYRCFDNENYHHTEDYEEDAIEWCGASKELAEE